MHNAGDPRQVRKAERKLRQIEEESQQHWRKVLKDPSGRYVLLELIEWCSVFRTLPVDPQLVQRSAGVQAAGLHILEKISDHDPGILAPLLAAPYLRRAKERTEREQEDKERQKGRDEDPDDNQSD